MKLPDVNLLIYAIDETSSRHEPAVTWWNALMSGTETVALAWSVMLAFLRLTTRPSVVASPLGITEAFAYLNRWIDQPVSTVIEPTRRHPEILQRLLEATGTAANLTTDAHLATLAIEHGATLCSADNDFARFAGLDWVNPLA